MAVKHKPVLAVETVPIGDLKPHPRNPRVHPESALARLAQSIETYGWTNPVLVDKDNRVLAGHARLKAAERLGITEVPVIRLPLSGKKADAYLVADNRLAELTEWDLPLLKDWLAEVGDGRTGFTDEELAALLKSFATPVVGLTADDAVPEQVDTVCQAGDLWELGAHRLLCGDATVGTDVVKLMGDDRGDMVFTDPPYAVGLGGKNRSLQSVAKARRIVEDIAGDTLSVQDTADQIWGPAFANLYGVTSPDAVIYVTMPQGGDQMMMMMMMMMSAHWLVKHELIWVKNSPTFSIGRLDYDYQHEPIVYGWKKGASHKWYGGGLHTKSVWNIDRPRESKLHPTMKPVALMENAVANSTIPRQIVVDVFGGSGSTLIACEKLQPVCRMMEIDPHYCDVIIKRWEDFTGQTVRRT